MQWTRRQERAFGLLFCALTPAAPDAAPAPHSRLLPRARSRHCADSARPGLGLRPPPALLLGLVPGCFPCTAAAAAFPQRAAAPSYSLNMPYRSASPRTLPFRAAARPPRDPRRVRGSPAQMFSSVHIIPKLRNKTARGCVGESWVIDCFASYNEGWTICLTLRRGGWGRAVAGQCGELVYEGCSGRLYRTSSSLTLCTSKQGVASMLGGSFAFRAFQLK